MKTIIITLTLLLLAVSALAIPPLWKPVGTYLYPALVKDSVGVPYLSDTIWITGAHWDWSDSSTYGPDSVLYADTASRAYSAGKDADGDSINVSDYLTSETDEIEDDVVGSGWNGDVDHGASQNALHDWLSLFDKDFDGLVDEIESFNDADDLDSLGHVIGGTADSAGYATKATQDGDGNTITSTYVPNANLLDVDSNDNTVGNDIYLLDFQYPDFFLAQPAVGSIDVQLGVSWNNYGAGAVNDSFFVLSVNSDTTMKARRYGNDSVHWGAPGCDLIVDLDSVDFDRGLFTPAITLGGESRIIGFSSNFTVDGTPDLDIATGGIGDNEIDYSAVTLADFDYQTAYQLFYSDVNGDVQELVHGTSGHVLKSNGPSADPSWQAESGGSSAWDEVGTGPDTSLTWVPPTSADTLARFEVSAGAVTLTTDRDTLKIGPAGLTIADSVDVLGHLSFHSTSYRVLFPRDDALHHEILKFDTLGDSLYWAAETGGSGEANTLADTGASDDASVFGLVEAKSGIILRMRTLEEGSNITLSQGGDSSVIITAAGGADGQDADSIGGKNINDAGPPLSGEVVRFNGTDWVYVADDTVATSAFVINDGSDTADGPLYIKGNVGIGAGAHASQQIIAVDSAGANVYISSRVYGTGNANFSLRNDSTATELTSRLYVDSVFRFIAPGNAHMWTVDMRDMSAIPITFGWDTSNGTDSVVTLYRANPTVADSAFMTKKYIDDNDANTQLTEDQVEGYATLDGAYPTDWDADTDDAASRNVLYDYFMLFDNDSDGTVNNIECFGDALDLDSAGHVISGTADSAEYATKDASGNTITTTYAPLASPAFTGIVVLPDFTLVCGDSGAASYDALDEPTTGQQLTFGGGDKISWEDAGSGSGETNTLEDTGTFNGTSGFGLAGGKTGTALKVKGLIEGTNITIAADGDSAYTITAAGGGGTSDSIGYDLDGGAMDGSLFPAYFREGTGVTFTIVGEDTLTIASAYTDHSSQNYLDNDDAHVDTLAWNAAVVGLGDSASWRDAHSSQNYLDDDVAGDVDSIDLDNTTVTEYIEDYAGALINDGTGTHTRITVTYQDATGDVDLSVDADLHNYNWTNVTGTDLKTGSVTQGYDTDLASLATATAWRMFYSDDADPFIQEIALGAVNTVLRGKGVGVAPEFGSLVDDDVPNTITASNYLLLVGGDLTGAVTTTSTFDTVDVATLAAKVHKEDTLHFLFSIVNPNTVYDTDSLICMKPVTGKAITVTRIDVTCDADPATEPAMSLRFANNFISRTTPTTIDVITTTAGVTAITSGFDDATIPASNCIYFAFTADPIAAITSITIDVAYTID